MLPNTSKHPTASKDKTKIQCWIMRPPKEAKQKKKTLKDKENAKKVMEDEITALEEQSNPIRGELKTMDEVEMNYNGIRQDMVKYESDLKNCKREIVDLKPKVLRLLPDNLDDGGIQQMKIELDSKHEETKSQILVGTQNPNGALKTVSKLTSLKKEQIEVNVTYLGGGFGRRSSNDFVKESVEIANIVKKPIKLTWSREEDMQNDYYRPASLHVMKGAIDQKKNLTVWKHRITAPSILFSQLVTIPFPFKEKLDLISTEGAKHIPYQIPNMQVDYQMTKTDIPLGFWRSVYSSQNAFANECFMDELAEKAGKDPINFRLELLPENSRDASVIELVADRSGWKSFSNGPIYQGFSSHKSFGTWVAQVARVSVENNQIKVHEVHCAVDCGLVINPNIVKTQISSAIIYGLSATLKSKITIDDGKVVESNFDDFDVIRMDETPKIKVYLVDSDKPPKGVGEPGLPPIAPAVTNAVYAATGKRFRQLPIKFA